MSPLSLDTPSEWLQWIDQPVFNHELTTLRRCVNRQQPFGAEEWQATIAAALGLELRLRRRGRPLNAPCPLFLFRIGLLLRFEFILLSDPFQH